MHNTPEKNEAFRKAFDATNARWKASVGQDMSLDTFEALLQKHDWHYQYAEGKAYYDGKASDDGIMQAMMALNKQGLGKQSMALWIKYKPAS